jgi:hypothetical protein
VSAVVVVTALLYIYECIEFFLNCDNCTNDGKILDKLSFIAEVAFFRLFAPIDKRQYFKQAFSALHNG